MIVKTSFKGNNILCKECEKQLFNISKVDTVKKVISVDNKIYY